MQDPRFVRMEYRQIWVLFEDFGHHGRLLFSLVTSGMVLQGIGDPGPHLLIIMINLGTFAPVRRTFLVNCENNSKNCLDDSLMVVQRTFNVYCNHGQGVRNSQGFGISKLHPELLRFSSKLPCILYITSMIS